jgi:flagellar export protein FliJ
MAKFAFRLDAALKLRAAERDRCRMALARSLSSLAQLNSRSMALDVELRALAQTTAVRPGAIEIDRLLHAERYAAALRRDLAACRRESRELESEIAQRRAALVAADQATRTLEILREKSHAHFVANAVRCEQQELDEIAARAAINETPS